MNRTRLLKLAVLILVTTIHIFWGILIPPYQGNDEERHFASVLFYIYEKRLISSEDAELSFRESEWYGDLRRDIISHESHRIFANTNYRQDFDNPRDLSSEVDTINVSPAYPYPQGYYILAAVFSYPFKDITTKLFAARLFSIGLSIATWIFVYKILKIITKAETLSIIGTVIVAFFPIFTYAGSIVNNDVMLGLAGTLSIYSLFLLKNRVTRKRLLLMSFAFTLGLLSKPQYLVIAIPVLILALQLIWGIRKKFSKVLFLDILAFFALPMVFAFPLYLHNLIEFNSPFPEVYWPGVGITGTLGKTVVVENAGKMAYRYIPEIVKRWFLILPGRFASDFGQVDTYAPQIFTDLFRVLFLISCIYTFIRLYLIVRKREINFVHVVFGTIALSLEGFYTFLWVRGLFRSGTSTFPLFARYYFPIIIIFAYFGIKLPEVFRKPFVRRLVSAFSAIAVIAYNVYCLSLVLSRYYI